MSVLRVESLKASYGHIEVLHGVTLEVRADELTCLIGANGAGKSTLLKAVTGLLRHVSGEMSWDGETLVGRPAPSIVSRGIVHVPEGRRIFPRMTVEENLRLGAFLRRDRAGIAQDLERAFALFPRLKERYGQVAGTLSGGEQQMVAIARGLMARPRLLLLDEPSLGLAPLLVQEIFRKLQEVHREGVGILLVEQNAFAALSIANRGYVMETGKLALGGPAGELLDDPRVQAAYLGGE
ncbi:MAG: ABC transporter ATP-binding protein [Candidatus Wallbacteria bacterium]|nr:ABC transporter ATP-binding protein [Candidatus Wallbacteria bacterium]